MTMARAHLVNVSITRWYHCITGCVRHAFLLSEGPLNHEDSIKNRPQELADIFALSVAGFPVMDNHLHVLVRLDPDTANNWSDEGVRARTRNATSSRYRSFYRRSVTDYCVRILPFFRASQS